MKKNFKQVVVILCMVLLMSFSVVGCGNSEVSTDAKKDIPTLRMAWGYDLHTGIALTAATKGEALKDTGVYLKEIVEREKYELISNGETLAIIQMIVTKGSSETAVLMGQKQIDLCSNSITGMMFARDQGTPVKVICPVHTDGIGMVFAPDTNIHGWEEVKNYINNSNNPVKIGYHSPTSAPRVVVESALKGAGFKVTENPNESSADVLLVDLKGATNLLPSLSGKQVDAWVGPSHYPEAADVQGLGNIAMSLHEFPPEGQWYDFPCCVFAAREEIVQNHPEVIQAMAQLFTNTAKWSNENKAETARNHAELIGIPVEAVEKTTLVFTTTPTEKWMDGVEIYVEALNELEKFEGNLKTKSFEEIKAELIDFTFIDKVNK